MNQTVTQEDLTINDEFIQDEQELLREIYYIKDLEDENTLLKSMLYDMQKIVVSLETKLKHEG